MLHIYITRPHTFCPPKANICCTIWYRIEYLLYTFNMFSSLSKLTSIITVALLPLVSADTAPFNEWAHGRVQLSNVSIHFRYAGSGPPLLLVHGNPQHSVSFY